MALTSSIDTPESGWRSALPDLIGCAFALLLAWTLGWRTGDLIWSMWLASLVIGYSLIMWKLFSPAILIAYKGEEVKRHFDKAPGKTSAGLGLLVLGSLFLLAFFTVHFGGFHWGHSIFLNSFYPISRVEDGSSVFSPSPADYWHVVKTYGWFLPLAFLAQRDLFEWPKPQSGPRSEASPSASLPQAAAERSVNNDRDILRARRKGRKQSSNSPDMGAAYKGVVKLHCLIFFLFAADALGLPEFLSYSVVYLVYFFPWSAVAGRRTESS